MTDDELLHFIKTSGIIDLDDVAKKHNMKILKDYQDKIWQATDGRYKIKMPNGKLLAKTRKEDLEQAIIDHCKAEGKKQSRGPIFSDMYVDWLNYKKTEKTKTRDSVKESTRSRYINTYNKHYKGKPIVSKRIKDITVKDVQDFLDGELYEYDMDKQKYYNFSVILNQVLDLAVEKGIIDQSPMDRYKLPVKLGMKKRPDPETQVLNDEELALLYKIITDRSDKYYIVPLLIELALQLGLRNGELVALKWTDIDGDYIYIQRTDIHYYDIDAQGKPGKRIRAVSDPKTKAGIRKIYLTSDAKMILSEIKNLTKAKGLYNGDWIAMDAKGNRHTTDATDHYLRRTCKRAAINDKSMHKLRKTTISQLLDAGMSPDAARAFAGHTDLQTIFKNYYFDRRSKEKNIAIQEIATRKIV
jgi:integrase